VPGTNEVVRLFVAIVPPAEVLAELADAVAPLRAASPELRWTGPEDWHLTLAFLGNVAQDALPDLAIRTERAARRHPAQRLAVVGAGAFPRPSRAGVVWAGISTASGLAPLAASVAAAARRAGAPPPDEGRRYRPHLTLARCRQPADVSHLTAELAGFAGQSWTAADICLIRSNLTGAPRYEYLGQWPLRP
jgi:RNA 2',3'-cyclic 3'-phosphodiesterase